jgi:NNP family nitrate/nitrite transporter-like MFS transporter
MLLFAIVAISLIWMHFAILRMERRRLPALTREERFRYLPEIQPDYKREAGAH